MKSNIILYLCAFTLIASLVACNNEDPVAEPEACETESFGHILFNNLVDNDVEVSVNGNPIGTVSANDTLRHKTAAGEVVITAKEDKLILPEKWDLTRFLESCEVLELVFEP